MNTLYKIGITIVVFIMLGSLISMPYAIISGKLWIINIVGGVMITIVSIAVLFSTVRVLRDIWGW
jgi:hypothetical protein